MSDPISIEKTDLGYTLRLPGYIAQCLCPDEALGTLAEWIYRDGAIPRYFRTIRHEAEWVQKYSPERMTDELRAALPTLLIEDQSKKDPKK